MAALKRRTWLQARLSNPNPLQQWQAQTPAGPDAITSGRIHRNPQCHPPPAMAGPDAITSGHIHRHPLSQPPRQAQTPLRRATSTATPYQAQTP